MNFTIKLCNNFSTIEFQMDSDNLDFDLIKHINDDFIKATSNPDQNKLVQPGVNKEVKMASQKQIDLVHKLKISDKDSMTYAEADKLIKDFFKNKENN